MKLSFKLLEYTNIERLKKIGKIGRKLEGSDMILPVNIKEFLSKIYTIAIKDKKIIFTNPIRFCILNKVFNLSNSKYIINKAGIRTRKESIPVNIILKVFL